jgi:hypothetical protein
MAPTPVPTTTDTSVPTPTEMETTPPPAEIVPALCVERTEVGGEITPCEGFPPLDLVPTTDVPVQVPTT